MLGAKRREGTHLSSCPQFPCSPPQTRLSPPVPMGLLSSHQAPLWHPHSQAMPPPEGLDREKQKLQEKRRAEKIVGKRREDSRITPKEAEVQINSGAAEMLA